MNKENSRIVRMVNEWDSVCEFEIGILIGYVGLFVCGFVVLYDWRFFNVLILFSRNELFKVCYVVVVKFMFFVVKRLNKYEFR